MTKIESSLTGPGPHLLQWLTVAIALFTLAGCAGGRPLMPVPNVYTGDSARDLFQELPEELKGNDLDLLYVTDRVRETDADGKPAYGSGRSRSVFDVALLEFACRANVQDDRPLAQEVQDLFLVATAE